MAEVIGAINKKLGCQHTPGRAECLPGPVHWPKKGYVLENRFHCLRRPLGRPLETVKRSKRPTWGDNGYAGRRTDTTMGYGFQIPGINGAGFRFVVDHCSKADLGFVQSFRMNPTYIDTIRDDI